jgi:hypothetical protein
MWPPIDGCSILYVLDPEIISKGFPREVTRAVTEQYSMVGCGKVANKNITVKKCIECGVVPMITELPVKS